MVATLHDGYDMYVYIAPKAAKNLLQGMILTRLLEWTIGLIFALKVICMLSNNILPYTLQSGRAPIWLHR